MEISIRLLLASLKDSCRVEVEFRNEIQAQIVTWPREVLLELYCFLSAFLFAGFFSFSVTFIKINFSVVNQKIVDVKITVKDTIWVTSSLLLHSWRTFEERCNHCQRKLIINNFSPFKMA